MMWPFFYASKLLLKGLNVNCYVFWWIEVRENTEIEADQRSHNLVLKYFVRTGAPRSFGTFKG